MKSLTATVFVLALAGISWTSAQDIYEYGPYTVQHEYYLGIFNFGLTHNIDVWAPASPGEFPTIYFVPGITGVIPADLYWDLLERISSHGFVVVGIWTLTELPTSQIKPDWLRRVDHWLQDHLADKLAADGFNPGLVLDFTKIFLMTHSSGAHVIVNFLKSDYGCDNINGLILFSPVDGLDPFGFLDYYCITPGEKLNFETPTMVISVGYDNVPGIGEEGSFYPPCAPDNMSNLRFWDAINGEAWLINATEYGHGDLLIEFLSDDVIGLLRSCSPGVGNIPIYHSFIAGEVVAFIKGVEGDCEMLKYLEDPSLMPVPAETQRQHGDELICQRGGFCVHH